MCGISTSEHHSWDNIWCFSLSSSVIPVHCTVHTEALALLDLSLLFKLCWPVVLQAMKWLDQDSQWQFDQTGSGHWSRAGETEIVGNTLGSTLGTQWTEAHWAPVPSYPTCFIYQCSFYSGSLRAWLLNTRMAMPSPWAPLSLLQLHLQCLYWLAASLPSQGETVPSRIQWDVSLATMVYWRPSSLKGRGQWATASPPLAINQGVSVTGLQRTSGQ